MKRLIGAAAVLASLWVAVPAVAHEVPGGSYLRSCANVQRFGDSVVADCRRIDGDWERTVLGGVDHCVGGIANTNGNLTCNYAGHQQNWERDRWNNHGWSRGDHWEGYNSSAYHPRDEWDGR